MDLPAISWPPDVDLDLHVSKTKMHYITQQLCTDTLDW